VHLVGFLFIVVIADARNHEPETAIIIKQFSVLPYVSTCICLLRVILNVRRFYSCLLYIHSMTLLDIVLMLGYVALSVVVFPCKWFVFQALSPTCQKRLLASSWLAVCPSVHTGHLCSHWTDFHEIWHISIFRKLVKILCHAVINLGMCRQILTNNLLTPY
jgi:hypothetical protein